MLFESRENGLEQSAVVIHVFNATLAAHRVETAGLHSFDEAAAHRTSGMALIMGYTLYLEA